MPDYAGRMLASKIAYYARNSAGRIYPSLLRNKHIAIGGKSTPVRQSTSHSIEKTKVSKGSRVRGMEVFRKTAALPKCDSFTENNRELKLSQATSETFFVMILYLFVERKKGREKQKEKKLHYKHMLSPYLPRGSHFTFQ